MTDAEWRFAIGEEVGLRRNGLLTKVTVVGQFLSTAGHQFYVMEFHDVATNQVVFFIRTRKKIERWSA